MSDMDDSPASSSNTGDYVAYLENELDKSDDFAAYLEKELESASETSNQLEPDCNVVIDGDDEEKEDHAENELDKSDEDFAAFMEKELDSASETSTQLEPHFNAIINGDDEEKEDHETLKYHIKKNPRSARPRRPRQDMQTIQVIRKQVIRKQGGTFFIRNVPLFCNYNHVIDYFRRYGVIEKIRFLHRTDKTYTLCCKIKMKNLRVVDEILNAKNHIIRGHNLEAEQYHGKSAHPDVFQRGYYKMEIGGLGYISEPRAGEILYTFMECFLKGCHYTEMQLERTKNLLYTGYIEVRFAELLDKYIAWKRLTRLGFSVSTPPRGVRVRQRVLEHPFVYYK